MNMIENFRVQEVGIDVSNLSYSPFGVLDKFDWINTSLTANNEFEIVEAIKTAPNAKLSVVTNFLDKLESALISQTTLLDRESVDLLLIDTECDVFEHKDNIINVCSSGVVKSIGIHCNPKTTVEGIINFYDRLSTIYPNITYVGYGICPLNFNIDLLNWMEENELRLIGFNPFGGHISAASVIDSFSVPFLLGFTSTYSDIVMLPGNYPVKSFSNADYIRNLIGTEVSPKYILTKTTEKLIEPMKRIVNTSLKVCENLKVPYTDTDLIFNPDELLINLGYETSEYNEIKKSDEKTEQLTKEAKVLDTINDFLDITNRPVDGDGNAFISLVKEKIYSLINSVYKKEEGYVVTAKRLTNSVFVFTIVRLEKKWDWASFSRVEKVVEEDNHFFVFSYFGKNVKVFQEIKETKSNNSDEKN